jgi:hypothetical protein
VIEAESKKQIPEKVPICNPKDHNGVKTQQTTSKASSKTSTPVLMCSPRSSGFPGHQKMISSLKFNMKAADFSYIATFSKHQFKHAVAKQGSLLIAIPETGHEDSAEVSLTLWRHTLILMLVCISTWVSSY